MNKLIIALVVCLSANCAIAAKPAPDSQNPFVPKDMKLVDVPLTSASVEKLLASFPRVREEFKDYKPSGDAPNEADLKKANSIAREAGFKDWLDWSSHFAKMMQTYMAYKMQGTAKVSQAQIAQAQQQMKALENDPNMTAEQKQMAKNMMGGMANMYTQMANVPEADLKTIKPFVAQLEQVMQVEK
jgi:cell fate (sporulation/competence/biofilm development) regulator YlbF (YheA/YmcA/DUF963 family)